MYSFTAVQLIHKRVLISWRSTCRWLLCQKNVVDSSWNVMAHGDVRVGKWRGNWRMQWVASTLHTTSEHDVSSITTADAAHLCCQQSTELTPTGRFKWTRPVSHERRILVSARVPLHFNWPLSRLHYRRNVQGVFFYTTAAVKMSVVTKMPAAFHICFHTTPRCQETKRTHCCT